MAHGESLRLRAIAPKPRVAVLVPRSAKAAYAGRTRKSKRELGAKGTPPWVARREYR